MKIAVFGCGLIGEKRASQLEGHTLVGFYDPDKTKADNLAKKLNTVAYSSEEELLEQSEADIVIVAAINSMLAPLSQKAALAGKHVLVEKPAGIRVQDLTRLKEIADSKKVSVKVGFNHRFHPAMLKARELIDKGALGELMYLRARYGHGARVGYNKEWRNVPEFGGGGELMDQGVHLLDLTHWFLGPLPLKNSHITTSFWDMAVDDNAVITVAGSNKWATFHVSCSEWKNTFSLEIYGRTGKLLIQGLGRSYGKETLTYYQMLPEMGPPVTEQFEFEDVDHSWGMDLENLVSHIKTGVPLLGSLESAIYSLEVVTEAYKQNGYKNLPCTASF